MPNHNVKAIANEFIRLAASEGIPLTNMKLQKLPYIAHGWCLALQGQRLIHEQVEAWPYGPVYPELYQALRRYGPNQVADFIHENDGNPFAPNRGEAVIESLTQAELDLINGVWQGYKMFDAFALSNMTHRDGTPWTETYNTEGRVPISDQRIAEHYRRLIAERTPA